MIKTFKHKGLKQFWETGSKAGIRPDHAAKLKRQLDALDAATRPEQMNIPGWYWHPLTGPLSGQYAVRVNGNWRLTYEFEDGNAVLLDYQDYH
jgi:toxin HigB-1